MIEGNNHYLLNIGSGGHAMNKVLFITEIDKQRLSNEINNELKIKNRLIKVLQQNSDHKLNATERNKLANKYQDQIILLESIRSLAGTGKNREDIQFNPITKNDTIKNIMVNIRIILMFCRK